MDLHQSRTHLIIHMTGDTQTAPMRVAMATNSAEKAEAKATGFRFWKYDVEVVALDDPNADARWKGSYATPREFFCAEYDDAGIPRDWIVRNALR